MGFMRWLLKDNPIAKVTTDNFMSNIPKDLGFDTDFIGKHYDKEDAQAKSQMEGDIANQWSTAATGLNESKISPSQYEGAQPGMVQAVGNPVPTGGPSAISGGDNTWKQMMMKVRK